MLQRPVQTAAISTLSFGTFCTEIKILFIQGAFRRYKAYCQVTRPNKAYCQESEVLRHLGAMQGSMHIPPKESQIDHVRI